MKLQALAIINFGNINLFSYANQWSVSSNSSSTLYFQIVDQDQEGLDDESGLRYLVGIGSQNQPYSVSVTFPSINTPGTLNPPVFPSPGYSPPFGWAGGQQFTLAATQASASDSSIWSVSIPANYTPNSGNVVFTILEGANSQSFSVLNMISVEYPKLGGSC